MKGIPHINKNLLRANQLEKLERFMEAIQIYKDSLNETPFDSFLWYSIARNYYLLDKIFESKNAMDQSLKIDPQNIDAICLKVTFMIKENRYDEAEDLIKLCLELDPQHIKSLGLLATILIKKEDFYSANIIIKKGLTIDPQNESLKQNLLLVHASEREYTTMEMLSDSFLSDDPENIELYLFKAIALIKKEKYDEAEELLLLYLSNNPGDIKAKLLLKHIYLSKNEFFKTYAGAAFGTYKNKISPFIALGIILLAMSVVFLWGWFFAFFMILVGLLGASFTTYLRFHPLKKRVLLNSDIQQSNFYLLGITLILFFLIILFNNYSQYLFRLFTYFIILFIVGLSYFELYSEKKKRNFFIAIFGIIIGYILIWYEEPFMFIYWNMAILSLYGLLYTLHIIGER